MFAAIKQNFILFLVITFGLVGAVWYGMSDRSPEALLTTETVEGGTDQELVSTLLALRTVSLDGTVFVNPGFTALRDFGSQIVPEPVGRDNPFNPLSQAKRQATTTQKATSKTDAVQSAEESGREDAGASGTSLFLPRNQ